MLNILHEDAGLLVVNKPAGLVCHPTKGDELSSLISRARLYLHGSCSAAGGKDGACNLQPSARARDLSEFSLRPCLVNRLDRETSGVVLLAKNSETAGELGKIFEARAVEKEYLAIVHGHVRNDHGLIDVPLGRDEQSKVAVKDCVRDDGTPAQTEFFVERRFVRGGGAAGTSPSSILHPPYSLLRLIPHTGRKHQIRIHLAHLGHPIVGDKLYGGDEDLYLALVENRLTAEQRDRLILPHQALHARAISFVWRGNSMTFHCNPEPWFTDFYNHE